MVLSPVEGKSINQPEGATPPPTLTVKDKKRKKSQVEAEKLNPQDKAPQTDNPDNSDDMDIEITEIIPPRTHRLYALMINDLITSIRYLESLRT